MAKRDVRKIGDKLRESGIAAEVDVVTGRKLVWTKISPDHATQIPFCDSKVSMRALPKQGPEDNGIMLYRLSHDATYVIIVERDDDANAWKIIYIYLRHKRHVNIKMLMTHIRPFVPTTMEPLAFEELVREVEGY